MAKIDAFFRLMNAQGASDLHLAAGAPPCLRIRERLEPVRYPDLESDQLLGMLTEIMPAQKLEDLDRRNDVDFGYALDDVGRFRAHCFRHAAGIAAVFRRIPSQIVTIEQLGLPRVARRFAARHAGLVLVAGPRGSGRTTTLAALVDCANRSRRDHVVTIEDPIEFKHHNILCIVNQREVGVHTHSCAEALQSTLREDPDVIVIGDLRDPETVALALEAAASGRLVLTSVVAPSAEHAVDRVVDAFPVDARDRARRNLSQCLQGVIAQSLFTRADRMGRVAAIEILVNTPTVADAIRDGRLHELRRLERAGKSIGMQTLDDSIRGLVRSGKIEPADAFERAIDKSRIVELLPSVPDEYRELVATSAAAEHDKDSDSRGRAVEAS